MQRAITPSRRGRAARLIGRGFSRYRRTTAIASVAVLAVTTMAACQSGSKAAAAELPSHGGTLNVILSNSPIVSLDPQEVSLATDANISREINRTLTTTNSTGQLVPDLATDTGRPSDNNTVWEFTLKPGVKWQDGSPVKCEDVKYGVERRYASSINDFGGLPYPMMYLKDNPDKPYAGPYVSTDPTLSSIDCIDDRTVQFTLQRPVGDFGYTVSVNTFAPMKVGADSRAKNDATAASYAPMSNGPYEVDPAQTKMKAFPGGIEEQAIKTVLVRNPDWDPGTDNVRKAYPDKIVITFDESKTVLTNNLITSTGDYQYAVNLDSDVTPNFVQQVINDPVLSKRAITGPTGALRYYAINTRKLNLTCRKALEYGFDKRAWRFVLGGSVFGQLATSIIPPNLPAHENFDLYETNTQQDGDVTQATNLWKAGHCPPTITAAYPAADPYPQLVSTVVTAYQRIGVQVIPVPMNAATYYQVAGDPNTTNDLIVGGWIADWPNGSAVIPPLFDSGQVTAALRDKSQIPANLNLAEFVDPSIDKLINQAYAEPDLTTQYHLWGEIDNKIMSQAATIPILYTTAVRMTGTKVRGGVMSSAYGEPDLATLGVVQ